MVKDNIALCIDYYIINPNPWSISLQVTESICWAIVMTLELAYMSLVDAVKIKRIWKSVICAAGATVGTFWLLALSLSLYENGDNTVVNIWGIGVSMQFLSNF